MGSLQWLYNPNAKPAKDLSKHDQRMIQLGWDAQLEKCHRDRPDIESTTCVGLENCCDLEAKIEQAVREEREKEAQDIIRCIKDCIRVHPNWDMPRLLELLLFREETRQALKEGEK